MPTMFRLSISQLYSAKLPKTKLLLKAGSDEHSSRRGYFVHLINNKAELIDEDDNIL